MAVNIDDLKITSYSGRNVGDIYYTLRKDEILNGAIECQGAEFNADDFAGYDLMQNPYKLCINGYIPYVSYSEYEQQVALHGCCASFAIDSQLQRFKVPTIKDVYIQPGDAESLAQYLGQQLPNLKGNFNAYQLYDGSPYGDGVFQKGGSVKRGTPGSSGDSSQRGFSFDAHAYDPTYTDNGVVRPNSIVLRAMIQLIVPQSQESPGEGEDGDGDGGGGIEQENLRMPYLHIPGTAAKATEVNANFEYLRIRIQKLLKNSAFVDLTSDQYIDGKKHFNQPISTYGSIKINTDKDSASGAHLDFCSRGSSVTSQIWEKESGYLALDKNPKDNSSDTSIATTKWVDDKFISASLSFQHKYRSCTKGEINLGLPYTSTYKNSAGIQVTAQESYYIPPSDGYQYLVLVGVAPKIAAVCKTDKIGLDAEIQGEQINLYGSAAFVPVGSLRKISVNQNFILYGYIRLGKV